MKRRLIHLLLLLPTSLLFSPLSHSQSPPVILPRNLHPWGALTLFHGLPSNHVRAIAQDRDGLLWFGTDSGLARYDGRRIEKLAFAELAFVRVLALALDPRGVLWLGTDNGAARLLDDRLSPIPETLGKTITAIAFKEGRVALVSDRGFIYDGRLGADDAVQVKTISPEETRALTVDSTSRGLPLTSVEFAGNVLLCGSLGRGLLTVEGSEVKEVSIRPRPFFVEALHLDPQSRLWLGAQAADEDSGLLRSDDLSRAVKTGAETGNVTAIEFDSSQNAWVGTRNRGAFLFTAATGTSHFTFENTSGGLRSNSIYAIFTDREGVVWLGTDKGVCRYDPLAMRVEAVSANTESNFVRAIYQSSDGYVWCGTNQGLFFRPQVRAAWRQVPALTGKAVYSIGEDTSGRLLAGTATGLWREGQVPRTDSTSLLFVPVPANSSRGDGGDSIRAIVRFRGITYVANFGSGVERLSDRTRDPVFPGELADGQGRQALSLYNVADKRLLIGTAGGGVYIYDGTRTVTDAAFDELRGKTVWSISQPSDPSLCFATDAGVYLYQDGHLRPILPGLDARYVVPAPESPGGIWCATADSGLVKVTFESRAEMQGTPVVARFDSEQGLPSQKTFALLAATNTSSDGGYTLLVGTNYGMVFYEPNQLPPILRAERVSGSRAFQEEEIARGIALEYPQDSLLVDLTAVSSRTFPEQFQYAFTLFDAAGKRLRSKLSRESQWLVEELAAGSYSLQAQAYSGDLVPSEALRIAFQVGRAPFPWTSTALAILLLLALLAMAWGYYQNRRLVGANDRLAFTNQQLAETRSQLADETEGERRRIARDLHDQTLADLRRLLLLTDRLPADDGASSNGEQGAVLPAAFRSEIESVSAEIRRICEDLSPSVLENVGLAAALEWALSNAVAHLPPDRRFAYEISCQDGIEERVRLSPVMQIHLYRIAQEAINNALRHSGATIVRLQATVEAGGDLVLEIADNGRGFTYPPTGKKGRGIANIHSRASLIDAVVDWHSDEHGTRFILRRGGSRR